MAPSQVVIGAEYDVVISGFATHWTNTAVATFGDGIAASTTLAASETSLIVHVTVSPNATAGVRDVVVTQDASATKWSNTFMVLDRETFTPLGTASQLSASIVRLQVNEPDFEFDTTTDVFGSFTGVRVTATPSFPLHVLNVSEKIVDTLILADPDAAIGAYDLTVVSRPGLLSERTFAASQVFTIVAGGAMPYTGAPVTASVAMPFESTAYEYTPMVNDAGTDIVVVQITSSSPDITPKVDVLQKPGGWNTQLGFASSTALRPNPGDVYDLVVWDSSGASGFSYTLSVVLVTPTPEEEPNDTPAEAKPLPIPGLVDAQLSSLTDVDFYKVTLAPGDVGKRLHAVTQPGDPSTDTVITIYKPDGTTVFGMSDDMTQYEDFLSNPVPAAGNYFIVVTFSPTQISYAANESHYELFVTLE